ncbi:hypothetical protein L1987_18697 [Smallanthus sonchifolius]|uniref:Uncharacterized protein n=1 Tax=Smallanthus sonchifolius TaxID=185202 RepID=A0ACB9J2M5_9ASTR|nr:hypothetical protein L1987_18697 [Smallanthus sonchifolius]
MQEGTPIGSHVLKMKAYVEQLSRLGFPISDELATDIILQSLPKTFNQFVMKFNMNNWEKSISKNEITREGHQPRQRAKALGKESQRNRGHWKLNFPTYLAELKANKADEANASGHINNKRISKLQSVGILESTGSESFDICKSCLSGKMTKAPFTGTGERTSDLLGLIHTDVCGPFRTMSRNGDRYFITFTDDYNIFGYVYLIKHKHEAFDIFKIFQNEVENQLGKNIKAIRSDRGGEYLNYEFDKNLKGCGIISQLTPPGTPQHNEEEVFIVDSCEPINYKAAIKDAESDKWLDAMKSDIQSMYENQVWDLVDLPPDTKAKRSKWVFKKKTDMDGNTHTFKARILIAIAAYYDYEIWQIDVKSSFLNGHLNVDIYMEQPKVIDEEIERMKRIPYASAIGSIMTKDMFLIYGGIEEELTMKCHTDASFQTDRDDSRSQSGHVFTLNGGAITWKSSKQKVVAQSTTESEYIAASEATQEAAWTKKFITDHGVVSSITKPIEIFCDNNGAIAQAKEPRTHQRTKHIL